MQTAPISVPKLSDSKLRDLTWNLDVQKNINGNEINPMKVNEGKIGE